MWTKTKPIAALLFYIALGAENASVKYVTAESDDVQHHRLRPRADTTSKAGKVGKQVCLEFATLNEETVKGSPDPIGADGPTGAVPCYASPPSGVCCTEAYSCYFPLTQTPPSFPDLADQNCTEYFECLEDPANGPVLVGDWWIQRDVSDGEIFFEEDAVCGRINSRETGSRTRLELWDDTYLGSALGLFRKFSVNYDVRSSPTTNTGYLNMYLRVADNTEYYDCRFDFLIPDAVGSGTLEVTLDTEGSANARGSNSASGSCSGTTTLQAFLDANPGAVMGVGNGEYYTFVLNTGSTGQDNSGQETCWSDVVVTRYDETGATFVDSYEFKTL